MWDLPPHLYHGLQRLVHGNYDEQRNIIQAFRRGKTLEVGCGTGLIASIFEVGHYIGIDIDESRIAMAKELLPRHDFRTVDLTREYHSFLEKIESVICHGSLHHIDDNGVKRLLNNIRRASRKRAAPIRLLLIEPVLPDRIGLNLPGYFLAKLDRGQHVRTVSEMINLLGASVLTARRVKGSWFWPVPGVVMELSVS